MRQLLTAASLGMRTAQGEPGAMTLSTLCAELLLQKTELLQTENENKNITLPAFTRDKVNAEGSIPQCDMRVTKHTLFTLFYLMTLQHNFR